MKRVHPESPGARLKSPACNLGAGVSTGIANVAGEEGFLGLIFWGPQFLMVYSFLKIPKSSLIMRTLLCWIFIAILIGWGIVLVALVQKKTF